jgi:aminoglycoside phosphotransferase family enzyme
MEKYLRDYESLYTRTQKLSDDLEEQVNRNGMLLKERTETDKVRRTHARTHRHIPRPDLASPGWLAGVRRR